MKFQQETGMSMTAGCLPMAVNFLVLFGLIEVVYRPLQYILRVPKELIDKAVELANSALGMNLMANNFTVQNDIINAVKSSPDVFSSVFSADQIASISDFNFMFLGIDLSRVPHFAFDAASLMLMIIPILSVVTMILSQIITMKMSGQEMQGAMKWMPWIMSLMFVYFGFTVPVGFSLYYTASNVVMLVQSIIQMCIRDSHYGMDLQADPELRLDAHHLHAAHEDTDVPAQRQAAEEHGPDVGISAHDAGDTEKMGQ